MNRWILFYCTPDMLLALELAVRHDVSAYDAQFIA